MWRRMRWRAAMMESSETANGWCDPPVLPKGNSYFYTLGDRLHDLHNPVTQVYFRPRAVGCFG